MKMTMDRRGRIEIPSEPREKLGLEPESSLEVRVEDGHLVLEPVPPSLHLVETDGVLSAVPDRELPLLTSGQVREVLEHASSGQSIDLDPSRRS